MLLDLTDIGCPWFDGGYHEFFEVAGAWGVYVRTEKLDKTKHQDLYWYILDRWKP
jgi:hypothetical protein